MLDFQWSIRSSMATYVGMDGHLIGGRMGGGGVCEKRRRIFPSLSLDQVVWNVAHKSRRNIIRL